MNVVLVPLAFFAFLAVVILGTHWIAYRSRMAMLRAISDIAAKGVVLDPPVLERLIARPKAPVGKWFAIASFFFSVMGAAVGTALAIGATFLGGNAQYGEASSRGMLVGASINLSIAVCYLALGIASLRFFTGRKRPAPKWDYGTALGLVALFLGAGAFAVGLGLTFGSMQYADLVPRTAVGMRIGALINLLTGVGFTALGVAIFRLFKEPAETRDG